MKNIKNKLRVVHFPQVGTCKKCFTFEVKNEEFANAIINALALQHLWLEKNHIIPDYSNAIFVEMFDETIADGKVVGWIDYWNEEEMMEWRDVENYYKQQK
jgi:hypothetical protein